jgi:hypothetical protein
MSSSEVPAMDWKLTMAALDSVGMERERQHLRWGVQELTMPEWFAVLGEEFGEVGKLIVEGWVLSEEVSVEELRREIVHVAAVAVSIVEAIDRDQEVESDE